MHINNKYMYHIQMSSHSSNVSIHIPYISGYPAGVTPKNRKPTSPCGTQPFMMWWPQPRHPRCRRRYPPGRMDHQIMGETMGKTRKTRFSAFGFWGSSQTKFWINPNTLLNGFFLKWRTPSYQLLSSQFLHFLWGEPKALGYSKVSPRLQFKGPHNGSCNRRNLKHGSTWLQVL